MTKCQRTIVGWSTAAAAAFIAFVLAWGRLETLVESKASQAWAPWIQAIGSIGAIGAATRIASRQGREALANERRHEAERLDALARMLVVLKDATRALVAEAAAGRAFGDLSRLPDGRRFQSLRNALLRVQLEHMSNEAAVDAFSDLQGGIETIVSRATSEEGLDLSKLGVVRTAEFIEDLTRHIVTLRAEAARLLHGGGPRHAAAAPRDVADRRADQFGSPRQR